MDPITKETSCEVDEEEKVEGGHKRQEESDNNILPITFFCQGDNGDEYDHFFDGIDFDADTSTWRHSQATLIEECNVTNERLLAARFDDIGSIIHTELPQEEEQSEIGKNSSNVPESTNTESFKDKRPHQDKTIPTMISLITGTLLTLVHIQNYTKT